MCAAPPLSPPQEGKLTASEGLGDLFKGVNDWDTALAVYRQAGAANKVVEALAAKGDFEQLATFTRSSGGQGLWVGGRGATWWVLDDIMLANTQAAAPAGRP